MDREPEQLKNSVSAVKINSDWNMCIVQQLTKQVMCCFFK